MRVRWRTLALLCGIAVASDLPAQSLDLNDKAFVSAARLSSRTIFWLGDVRSGSGFL